MTSVLVLGAGGFLGAHTVRSLKDAGADVIPGPSRAQLDLAGDPGAVEAFFGRIEPDAVVNATGQVGGSPEELERGNVLVTRRLLRAVAPGTRFVQLGSLAEYGDPATGPWSEDTVAQPVSDYGRAKLRAGTLVLESPRVEGVVLRVANPVGSGQPAGSLVGAVIGQLLAPGHEVRLGALDARRDIVSARDVGRAAAAAAMLPDPPSHRLMNVGTGRSHPLRDVVGAVLRQAGGDVTLIEGVLPGSARSAAVLDAVPDVGRAAAALGWVAQDDLETAVRDALDGAGLLP
ncbi:NAD-dependent epimerase/dehydratase family protein [Kineosporia succinea]|uniref:Nucleoside-diphosphate-sugar epimerase n=1 Tax=Kineosporia succinea TaxID=84632 RepID=A0ABT9PCT7_9ACTN|nr:NAD-dependent epimerase/dehydratase family protein [Kineosporia succinea]MDP9830527.1 nucleoside-diphosphate-sugar epimerase [Kineosporia succinea]